MADQGADFLVSRADLRTHKLVDKTPGQLELQPGQALLRIDRFAFTANNITYGVAGDMLYWKFFPAPDGWGQLPVWGFADVVESRSDAAAVGTRVYGYFPMSTHLVVEPKAAATGFVDGVAHRSQLPVIYNNYTTAPTDRSAKQEDYEALFRPLFTTSFLLDDFIQQNEGFGAETVVVGSASSKTALGMAQLLSKRDGVEVIGLTSPGNVEFLEGLSCYSQVLTYDAVGELPKERAVVYVDMSGNSEVTAALHNHLGDCIKHHAQVGMTHWDKRAAPQGGGELPGPAPILFFAPTYAVELMTKLGRGEFQERLAVAWDSFMESLGSSIEVVHDSGAQDVARVYDATVAGDIDPRKGQMLSLL